MSYQVNLPHSVTLRPNGPALYSPPPKPIGLGYIMDTPRFRMTTGDPGIDNLVKYGFWFGMAAALYKLYGMLRYDEPIFSPGTPPAWRMNPSKKQIKKALFERVLNLYVPGELVGPVAKKVGVTSAAVIAWMKEAGVYEPAPGGTATEDPPKRGRGRPKKIITKEQEHFIISSYESMGKSSNEIAEILSQSDIAGALGTHSKAIERALKRHGISAHHMGSDDRLLEDAKRYEKEIVHLRRFGMKIKDIANYYGFPKSIIVRLLKSLGIR